MEFLEFEEIEDILKQLNYTEIKKSNGLNVYEAVNINGQNTIFQVIKEGNNYRIINNEMLDSMLNKKDFQFLDVEFISDDGTYFIYVNDYSKGHNVKEYSVDIEEIDVSYKFL